MPRMLLAPASVPASLAGLAPAASAAPIDSGTIAVGKGVDGATLGMTRA